MAAKIEVTGLREFQRALKQMDTDLPKQLRVALNEAAGLVVDYASARFPRDTGAAAASLKARSTQRTARVALGGRRAPYAPGVDFGGGRPQFPPYRPDGRYVYQGLKVNRDEITEVMSRALTDLAKMAGLEVT